MKGSIPLRPTSRHKRAASRLSPGPGRGRALLSPILAMVLCCPLMARDDRPAAGAEDGQAKKLVESPLKHADAVYKSGGRRDPFFNPLLVKKQGKKTGDEEISRGLPPPGIAGTFIEQATLHGIAIRNEGKVAVIRGSDSRAYFLKEGDKLFDGYLKEIQNDSVTLVRETRMKSGKVLTQDVTKRLRTP